MSEAYLDGGGAFNASELASEAHASLVSIVDDEFGKTGFVLQAERYDKNGDGVISKSEIDVSTRDTRHHTPSRVGGRCGRGGLFGPHLLKGRSRPVRRFERQGGAAHCIPRRSGSSSLDTGGDGGLDTEVAVDMVAGTVGDILREAFKDAGAEGDMLFGPGRVAKLLDPLVAQFSNGYVCGTANPRGRRLVQCGTGCGR